MVNNVEAAAQIFKKQKPYDLPESNEVKRSHSLLYGETAFKTAGILLEKYTRPIDKIFYDLGSGIGNVVIRAALSEKFTKVTGIETVEERYQMSSNIFAKCLPLLPEKTKVELIKGDFLQADFSDANIVYINAIAFNKGLMKDLQSRLAALKPGTRIIISDQQLDPKKFSQIDKTRLHMDYGDAEFYVYERK